MTGVRSAVHRLLRGTDDDRLRASWRLLLALAITFAGALLGALAIQRIALPALYAPVASHFFATVSVIAATVALTTYVDHRPVAEYGIDGTGEWLTEAVAGFVLGVALVGVAFAVNYQRGAIAIVDTATVGVADSLLVGAAVVVLGWLLVGFWEETLFRGLVLTNVAEGFSARGLSTRTAGVGAWLVSSLLYGLLHGPFGSSPDADTLAYALLMTVVMGGLFGVAYLLSGELSLPIGLHVGINLAEQNLFLGDPGGIVPAVLRVQRVRSGGSVEFQSMDPVVMVPVFLLGYGLVAGWCYLRSGTLSIAVAVPSRAVRDR